MKIFKFLLHTPLLLASLAHAEAREPMEEVPERNADADDGEKNELPCAVSPDDGTFRSTEGSLVEAAFTFRLQYVTGKDMRLLLKEMSQDIGNDIIAQIFPSCTESRRLFEFYYDLKPDVASVISGMDTNIVYARNGPCIASSESTSCEILTGGFKLYLNDSTGRKLYVGAAAVQETILGIVKELMDSGDAAEMVDGIEDLTFGRADGEPNEESGEEDEKAADELEQEILKEDLDLEDSKEDVAIQSTNGDLVEEEVPEKKGSVVYIGAILAAVSTVVVALVVHQHYRRKKETYIKTPSDERDFEVENILVDVEKSSPDEEFVEVVFDSGR